MIPLSFEECERIGGHCWVSSDVMLLSNPPQFPQSCKHCGATRVGRRQASMAYSPSQPPPQSTE